ncbi:MAG: S24 family peptidase [Planctomycetes bacterium]|nr:S24 family peptidase [Planctomycetota bacterium]
MSYGDAGYPAGHGIDKMQRPKGVTDPHAYGLIVKGDSMMPALPEGTVVVARTNEKARVGDIVICREKKTDKVYIKLLKHNGQTVVLESFNMQEHDPLIFQQGDLYFMHPVVSWNKAKKV